MPEHGQEDRASRVIGVVEERVTRLVEEIEEELQAAEEVAPGGAVEVRLMAIRRLGRLSQ